MTDTLIVSKLFRHNDTCYSSHHKPNAELVYVKVLKATDTMKQVTTGNGRVWRINAEGPQDIEHLFPDLDPEIREKHWIELCIRLRALDNDLGELTHTLQLFQLLRLYYNNEISWADIEPFTPKFSGISKKSVDSARSDWLATADYNTAQLQKLKDAIIAQVGEITGKPFAETFLLGNDIFYHDRSTPSDTCDHVLPGFMGVTSPGDEHYELTRDIYRVQDALYTAVGGIHQVVTKLGEEGRTISFNIHGVQGHAETKLKRYPYSDQVAVYVEVTSPNLPRPFRFYL